MILTLFFTISALVFLFVLFELGKEDFILIRKNVTLEQLFNVAFLTLFFAVFFARIVFVLLNPSIRYLNPLVFGLIPYFPGLSIFGGIIGAGAFLFAYARLKKINPGRLMDFFSLAFLACAPFGYFGYFFITKERTWFDLIISPLSYLIIFFIYMRFLLRQLTKGNIREGSLSAIFLMTFSLLSLIANLAVQSRKLLTTHLTENILYIILFLLSCVYVIWQEIKRTTKPQKAHTS